MREEAIGRAGRRRRALVRRLVALRRPLTRPRRQRVDADGGGAAVLERRQRDAVRRRGVDVQHAGRLETLHARQRVTLTSRRLRVGRRRLLAARERRTLRRVAAAARRRAAPTALRPLFGVNAHVPRDHVAPRRRVRTVRTAVRLLARVRAIVRVQVIAAAEYLSADATLVRSQAGVQSHVTCQHVAATERLVTHLTYVYLVTVTGAFADRFRRQVVDHVIGQVVERGEHLPADGTDEVLVGVLLVPLLLDLLAERTVDDLGCVGRLATATAADPWWWR